MSKHVFLLVVSDMLALFALFLQPNEIETFDDWRGNRIATAIFYVSLEVTEHEQWQGMHWACSGINRGSMSNGNFNSTLFYRNLPISIICRNKEKVEIDLFLVIFRMLFLTQGKETECIIRSLCPWPKLYTNTTSLQKGQIDWTFCRSLYLALSLEVCSRNRQRNPHLDIFQGIFCHFGIGSAGNCPARLTCIQYVLQSLHF